ncbi:MAG: RluA family pseudouridine synthase, partial [Clostridia bacterium]|nr:RluA family pseudouridine synthase [Clostridia bacterium]
MRELSYPITEHQNGQTVKSILLQNGFSTAMIRRLKQNDGIWLSGISVTVRHLVQKGQILTVRLPEVKTELVPIPMELTIVYEDDWLLVVNKPSGMPVHPSQGHHGDTLANGIAHYFAGTPFTFHPITRLDRYTAGLTLIAKNPIDAARLCDLA